MKMLVVDDNPRRYSRLVEALNGKVARGDIDIVTCAMDARDKLRANQYDILVIDIVIPLRPEDDPEDRNSRELLAEILEFDDLKRPGRIVGLSAYQVSDINIGTIFKDYVWTVINYSEANDDWISQIINCIDYINEGEFQSPVAPRRADIVIICALQDPELRAILQLNWNWSAAKPVDDVTFVHEGSFEIDGRPVSVVASAASRMGMVSAALLSAKLIEFYRPRFIVMAGICAGVRGKVLVGDVILADPSWDWQSGKRVRDSGSSTFSIAPHQLGVHMTIRAKVDQMRIDRASLLRISEEWSGTDYSVPKIVIGPVASGSAVLADGSIVAEIRNQQRDLCGIEMEAYGVYSAAHFSKTPQPLAFALKSVCDYADPDKNDEAQRYAAYTSASVIRVFFERYFFDFV